MDYSKKCVSASPPQGSAHGTLAPISHSIDGALSLVLSSKLGSYRVGIPPRAPSTEFQPGALYLGVSMQGVSTALGLSNSC